MKDYYEILGLEINSTQEQIKKAYRVNAIKFHPDKHSGDPVFSQKFIEIKEAFDVLSNISSKQEYDVKYQQFFAHANTGNNEQKKENKKEREQERHKEEEKFHYDPYKPFYSSLDREQQETPQFKPHQTPWGEKIPDEVEFLFLPSKIGKIIGGFSNLIKDQKRISIFEVTKMLFKNIVKVLGIIILISVVHYFYLKNTHKDDPLLYVVILWTIIASVIIFLLYYFKNDAIKFQRFNFFIGINGFAFYKCEGERENITDKMELNFNDVTDLIWRKVIHKRNFNYMHTEFEFGWLNRKTKKLVYQTSGKYYNKEDNPNVYEAPKYWANHEAEKYWTIFLLDNMEKTLEANGFIEFNLFPMVPYIRIGIGYITFLKGDEKFTYNFNDIKRIYSKGTDLIIEHLNFEKKLLFLKSGNQDCIPLSTLCNRLFFYKAMELLLGYKIA